MARDPTSPVVGTYRIFFVSDLHGSEVCFRKFLNSVDAYHPDALVYGGDILGKLLVPLFDDGRGAYHWYPSGEKGGGLPGRGPSHSGAPDCGSRTLLDVRDTGPLG